MEDQTQAVLGDEEDDQGDQEESDINPVGYLRVLNQKDLEQIDYPVQEGEVTLGRGSDCDLVIEARSLSRRHATVLVEGGTHFIQDLDSRNKTYRRTVQLRPNAFYELTHGCELTFADIKCVYYIGSLPEEGEEEEGEGEAAANEEATQAYSVGEEEGGGEGGGEKEEGDSDETDDDDDDVNVEPTQAYHFDEAAAEGEEEEEGEGEEPMDCDPTVAYHIEAAEDDDNEDSPPSSPILVTTKQLLPKEDASKTESSSPSGAKKSKKVCFATGTAPGSVEGEASTSKASTPKKEEEEEEKEGGGDETDGEETDGEEEPCKEEKESKAEGTGEGSKSDGGGGVGTATTPALKEEAGAESAMDVDEGDPTMAYELETDEENTETENSVGGTKEERKTEGKEKVEGEGAAGGADPTVPYNLKEEEEEEDDSDKTDVQEKSETVLEASKVPKTTEAEAVSGSSKKEGAAATKTTTAGEQHSEETYDGGGDTEKVECSATEPESQEVKEKPAHLRPPPRVARNAKNLSAVSLMDCTEQGLKSGDGGGATVQLDSYESTCDETVPLHPSPPALAAASTIDKGATAIMATVAMETLPLSPSTAAKEEEEKKEEEEESREEPKPPAGAQLEEVKKEEESDSSDSLIPEVSSLGSKGIGKRSKQKTLFDVVSSQRGRGRGGRRGRGRKATVTRKAGTRIDEPLDEGDTKDKKLVESKSDARTETAEPTLDLKTEEDADKKNKVSTDGDAAISKLKTLDSIGGISGKVANLRLKTLSLVVPDTASSGEIVNDGGASATIARDSKNETAASSEGVKVKEQGSKRGRGRGRRRTTSRQTSTAAIGRSKTITEATSTAAVAADTVDLPEEEESPDLPFLSKTEDDTNDQSDHSISTTSTASLESSHSGRGRKGKGRGGASKRGRAVATPRRKSTETAPKARTPSSTPSLRQHRTPSSASRVVSKSPSSTPGEKPRIMFTGLIDKNGERTIRELGGELVDSVYQCTHLITDKVRRTVKFLCCLSRGCLIVSDAWLDQCAAERRFLPAEPYLIKDKPAERQHKFTLQRSHESAKVTKLLAGYKVYLTPNVKPEREQMSDIIKCSGGEVFDFVASSSLSPGTGGGGEKVIVVACEEDLALCKDAMESGVTVHSTELILGGVLRQELKLHDHLMTTPASSSSVAGRKRRAKESSIVPAAKRKRK